MTLIELDLDIVKKYTRTKESKHYAKVRKKCGNETVKKATHKALVIVTATAEL